MSDSNGAQPASQDERLVEQLVPDRYTRGLYRLFGSCWPRPKIGRLIHVHIHVHIHAYISDQSDCSIQYSHNQPGGYGRTRFLGYVIATPQKCKKLQPRPTFWLKRKRVKTLPCSPFLSTTYYIILPPSLTIQL